MCNNLKNGNRVYKIPEWGFGYKVFDRGAGWESTLVPYFAFVRFPKNEWIKWEGRRGEGFCFFASSKDTQRFLKLAWGREKVIHKIRYRGGLGRRIEVGFMSSLCKEFKILKEVDIKELK